MSTTTKPAPSPKMETLISFLKEKAGSDTIYIKSRDIAAETELNTSEIGALITRVNNYTSKLQVTEWSRTNATTWKIN